MNDAVEALGMFSSLRSEAAVQVLEEGFLKHPQVECPVIHRFGPGLYIREVTIPADTFSVGHRQTTAHINIMLEGRVTMVNEDGSHTELRAPQTFVAPPGRKVGYIHEKMVWLNVYATTETDVEILEATYLDKSPVWRAAQADTRLLLGADIIAENRADYLAVLAEFGISHELARSQTENITDQIPFPYDGYKIVVAPSELDGRGVFATAFLRAGEVIAPARLGGMRTPAGRFTNHTKEPNAIMQRVGDDIYLVASRGINGCHGGTLGEEVTVDYRQALRLTLKGI